MDVVDVFGVEWKGIVGLTRAMVGWVTGTDLAL
jgi:hypothetical protein